MPELIVYVAGADMVTKPGGIATDWLFNVPNNGANPRQIYHTKNIIQHHEVRYVLNDSGGYQINEAEKKGKQISFDATQPLINTGQSLNIHPVHVIEAARHLRPHFMTALDFPICTLDDPVEQETEFLKKLGNNVDWAIQTSELWERYCQNTKLLLPVQCFNLEQFERNYRLIKNLKYSGLSMPLRNLSISQTALFLLKFWQIGIRIVHLLGTTAFFQIALAAYFARHYFDLVSLDSTSWRINAISSFYMNPHNLQNVTLTDDVIIDDSIMMDCPCPWCRDMTFSRLKNYPYKDKRSILYRHNYWVAKQAAADFYQHADTLVGFVNYIKSRTHRLPEVNALYNCLSMIDLMKNRDVLEWKHMLI